MHMDIKLLAKNEKELETLIQAVRIYSEYVKMKFSREKCTMLIRKSGKTASCRRNRINISRKNQNARRKGNLQILGNFGSGHHQTCGDERKNLKKNTSEERENYSKLNNIAEISSKDENLGCFFRKILGAILKENQRRTRTNGPENKKTHINV